MAMKLARSKQSVAREYPEPGDVLAGKYRIERVIGEGGMGVVYAAHHELLDQRVAVKLLFADAGRDAEAVGRFLQEARAAARLQSEHVAAVKDIDTLPSGLPFIVMEYLEGNDLSELIDTRGPQAPMFVVDCMLQALEALSLAHAQGIIHRDLKPSNLFLTQRPDGSQIVKILDFGISKTYGAARQLSTLTSSRSVLGSPPYMSPEQVRSPRTVDLRTDIWSLGVVMYELLTAKMPFAGEEIGETFAAILEKTPEPIRALNPRVPEGLEAAIMKCLSRDREKRFANVAEVAAAIAPFGSGRNTPSVERIRQTLARTDELSKPRGRLVSSSSQRVAGTATTVDASGPMEGREELSPTASTVRKDRFTLFGRPAVTPIAAIVAVVVSFVFVAVGIGLLLRSQRRAPPSAAATNAPVLEDPAAGPLFAPAATSTAASTLATATGAPPTAMSTNVLPWATTTSTVPQPPAPTATLASTTTPLEAPARRAESAPPKPPPRTAPPPSPPPAKLVTTVTRPQSLPSKDLPSSSKD